MKRAKKIIFMIATALIGGGIIVGTVGFGLSGNDIISLNMTKSVTNSYEVSDSFSNIVIESETADIRVLPSEDGTCRVDCSETDKLYHTVTVENDTLNIIKTDERKWYHHIGIFWGKTEITVYLPQESYASLRVTEDTGDIKMSESISFADVEIKTHTGDVDMLSKVTESLAISTTTGKINIRNAHVDSLKADASTGSISISGSDTNTLTVRTSTGKVRLSDTKCRSIHIEASTGKITAERVTAEADAVIRCDTGDIRLIDFDAELIDIKTDTGDIYGELLSNKIFTTKTDTGKINVPRSEAGGRCDVVTDTGNIEFKIKS